jgi:hypothetical protein
MPKYGWGETDSPGVSVIEERPSLESNSSGPDTQFAHEFLKRHLSEGVSASFLGRIPI